MSAKWNNDNDANKIARKLEECKEINDSGNIGFKSFSYEEYVAMLSNIVGLHKDIPSSEKNSILVSSVHEAGKKGNINKDSLLEHIRNFEVSFLKQPMKRFVLCTSMSIKSFTSFRNIVLNNTIISFDRQLPQKFALESHKLLQEAKRSIYAELPTNYFSIRVFVSARSPLDAAQRALEALDLPRGIWNLYFNRSAGI